MGVQKVLEGDWVDGVKRYGRSLNTPINRTVLVVGVVAWFCANAFGAFNPIVGHDSVSELFADQWSRDWQLSLGRYLQWIVWAVRGPLSTPWLCGMIALVFEVAASALAVKTLSIKSRMVAGALTAVMVVNATNTCALATYLELVDIYAIALFLAVLCAYLALRGRWLLGAVALFFSLGLYMAYLSVALVLMVVVLIGKLLKGNLEHVVVKRGFVCLGTALLGVALWWVGSKVALVVTGITAASGYNGVSGLLDFSGVSIGGLVWQAWCQPFDVLGIGGDWLQASTYRPWVAGVVTTAVMVFGLVGIGVCAVKNRIGLLRTATIVLLLALLPLCASVTYLASKGTVAHMLTTYGSYMLVALPCLVADMAMERCGRPWRNASLVMVLLLAWLVFAQVVFANQAYEKKVFEIQAADFQVQLIANKLEDLDGYEPGVTPVFFDIPRSDRSFGFVPENPWFASVRGTGLDARLPLTHLRAIRMYINNVLNYPCNVLSSSLGPAEADAATAQEIERLKSLDEVQNMPEWPAEGSVAMVDGTAVVKLPYNRQ